VRNALLGKWSPEAEERVDAADVSFTETAKNLINLVRPFSFA